MVASDGFAEFLRNQHRAGDDLARNRVLNDLMVYGVLVV
jgi:hypothetical protein